jgi:5-methylcytosine-specific restriction endonuclease McrA
VSDSKRCAKCGEVKSVDDFGPSKQQRDGKFPYCRPCKRVCDKVSAAKYKEARSASAAARYAANPEPAKARSRARYERDPGAWKASSLRWTKANPEKRKAVVSGWQKRNKDAVNEATRRRYARRRGATVVRFTKAQLEQRMAYWDNRCWMCHGPRQAIDHVKPLSRGGAHMLCNLRPVCWSCNSSKNDAWPVNTARRT